MSTRPWRLSFPLFSMFLLSCLVLMLSPSATSPDAAAVSRASASSSPNQGTTPSSAERGRDFAPSFMPLNPEVVSQYKDAGLKVPIEKTEARFIGREGATINRPSANRPTLNRPSLSGPSTAPLSPNTTTLKAIVILVGFTDNPPGGPTTRFRATVWDSMLFKDAYIRSGSHPADTTTIRTLKNYYREVSYAQVDVVTLNLPSAIGWVYAPNNYAYYCTDDGVHDNGFGPYPNNVQRLVMDAVIAADPVVDFSQYASGGWVQNLFVVHAGSGAEWSGGPKLIWSHAWSIATGDGWGNTPPALYVDGVRVGDYSMEPEAGGDTMGEAGSPMTPMLPTVGVYCHEFGHILGLPDEYDYGYESQGVGRFSLMAGGSWSRVPNVYPDCAGNSPSHPSAWCIEYLGFVTPVTVTTATTGITIPPIETTPTNAMYKVVYPGTSGKEYWLLENRQQIGFDQGFITMTNAAHGLCIYHVDQNVLDRTFWLPNEAECVSGGVYQGTTNCNCASLPANPNNGEKWYGVSVEQADGLYQMELGTSSGYWQDFYSSATGKTAFNAASSPNSSSYYNHYSCAGLMAATNISEVSQNITLDLTPDAIAPTVSVVKPNGGETFYFSTQDTIRWTAGDNLGVDHIDIYYSTDGGSTFPYTVSTGEANDGWYLWTIPATASTTCKVKVVAYDAAQNPAEDVSDATFTIRATPAVPALSPLCVVALAVGLAAVAGLLIGRKRLARRS